MHMIDKKMTKTAELRYAMGMAVAVVVGVLMGVLMVMPVDMVVGVAGMGLVLGRLVDVAVPVGVEGHVAALLLFPAHGDRHLGAGDAALHSGLGGEHHPRQAQAIHALHKALGVGVELQQGCGEHISGGAHVAFQVQCFHSDAPFRDRLRKGAMGPT